jgi:hypothetical protein
MRNKRPANKLNGLIGKFYANAGAIIIVDIQCYLAKKIMELLQDESYTSNRLG